MKNFSIEARKITYKQSSHYIFIHSSYTAFFQCSEPTLKSGQRHKRLRQSSSKDAHKAGKTQVFNAWTVLPPASGDAQGLKVT